MVSGMFSPLSKLPSTLRTISELLPSTALAQAFHMTLQKGESVSMEPWLVLIGWAFLASVAASRLFRWE
ncbi:MAG TPA: hypothetical protein VMU77_06665, partial [Acidimicrobiales bacterium]|nr:hypothetical protein [Acidimicrobiales bacterium]